MTTMDQPGLSAHLTFPTETSTTSYWRSQPHRLEDYRTSPELPAYSDVLVIGAGMSGVSIAYNVLHPEQPSTKAEDGTASQVAKDDRIAAPDVTRISIKSSSAVTIIEARGLCSGATGRNGGHLKLAFAHLLSSHSSSASVSKAIEIGEYQLAQLDAMKQIAEREDLDGKFLVTRSWDVIKDAEMWKYKTAQLDALRTAIENLDESSLKLRGIRMMNQIQCLSTEKLGIDAVEQITGVKEVYGGALGVPAASLWPYKFVCSLTERILDRINLQTNTVVRQVSETPDEAGWFTISTDRGEIKAHKVVFATNAYTAGILPMYESIVMPVKGTACHTIKKPSTRAMPTRTVTYNIHRSDGEVDYLNHRPEGGAVVGGAYKVIRPDIACCVATVDDSTLTHETDVREYFINLMQTNYRDWGESGADIDHLWTGIMGVTPDSYPHIGPLPGRPGHYICAGFNGAGMLHIFLAAKGLARMIRDESVKIEDTGIPSMFSVTEERMRQAFPPDRWGKSKGSR